MNNGIPPEKAALIKAVMARYDSVEKEIAHQVARAMVGSSVEDLDMQMKIQTGQNVMRVCLEALVDRMVPFPPEVAAELSIRLASYAISILPLEDQDIAVASLVRNFALVHQTRTAKGIRINCDWKMNDGDVQPNYPD